LQIREGRLYHKRLDKKKSRLKNRPAHQAIGGRWVGGEPSADIYLSAKDTKT